MKKHFSKFLSLTIGVIMLVSLSVAAYADKPAAEPYTPTAETTLGDICRHFEPEWFASLPADIQSQYDETLLNDVSGERLVSLIMRKGKCPCKCLWKKGSNRICCCIGSGYKLSIGYFDSRSL